MVGYVRRAGRADARRGTLGLVVAVLAVAVAVLAAGAPDAGAQAEEDRPQVTSESWGLRPVLSGLTLPTAVRFAPDGSVFVIEQRGTVKHFNSVDDPAPTTVIDLSPIVMKYGDRGLLGLAVDPAWPQERFIYLAFTVDAPPGLAPPVWNDSCPDAAGPGVLGCIAHGRLVRVEVGANHRAVAEPTTLIEDWCIQGPTHTVGNLMFDPSGALLMSAGEGAPIEGGDVGQFGKPGDNPCNDPTNVDIPAPQAQGGSLRSQALRGSAAEPTLDGTLIRVDAATGSAIGSNPLAGKRGERIVAYGFRNPFRFTIRPGTSEVWVADTGEGTWEEIDRVVDVTKAPGNYGWPCYEGSEVSAMLERLGPKLCTDLWGSGPTAVVMPYYAYKHREPLGCADGGAISAIEFIDDKGPYPDDYKGSLWFGDYGKGCVWSMRAGADGLPDRTTVSTVVTNIRPVDIQRGPDGSLYVVDVLRGSIDRLVSLEGAPPPEVVLRASRTSGPAPLAVSFDAYGSKDPSGRPVTFAWDLDGDGSYTDSTRTNVSYVFENKGTYRVGVRVTDRDGRSTDRAIDVVVGSSPPGITISAPVDLGYTPGAPIHLTGQALDVEDGAIAPPAMDWVVRLHECAPDAACEGSELATFPATDAIDFTPGEYDQPSYLSVELRAVDSSGLTGSHSVILVAGGNEDGGDTDGGDTDDGDGTPAILIGVAAAGAVALVGVVLVGRMWARKRRARLARGRDSQ